MLLFLFLCAHQVFIVYRVSPQVRQGDVLFWWPQEVEKHVDFAEVSIGEGLDNIGLFGELPNLLAGFGFQVRKTDSITPETLAGACTCCLLAPFRELETREKEYLQAFVTDGGHLLVAAEHTDLDHVQARYNELLEMYGISVNFDTATSLLDNSTKGTRVSNHWLSKLFCPIS